MKQNVPYTSYTLYTLYTSHSLFFFFFFTKRFAFFQNGCLRFRSPSQLKASCVELLGRYLGPACTALATVAQESRPHSGCALSVPPANQSSVPALCLPGVLGVSVPARPFRMTPASTSVITSVGRGINFVS